MKVIILHLLLTLNPHDYPIVIDRATTYNAVVSQTDSDPYGTADGSRIDPVALYNQQIRWCALSRDLINDKFRRDNYPNKGHWNGLFRFGDTINVRSETMPHINGKWVVRDAMNSRYKRSIDFLFDRRNNVPKLGVLNDVEILTMKK